MATETIRRLANISEDAARDGIKQRFPGAEILSFAREGQHFVAEIDTKPATKTAEFPFGDKKDEDAEGDTEAEDTGGEDAEGSDDSGDDSPADDSGDSDAEDGGDDPLGLEDGGDEGDAEPTLSEVMNLVKAIADHLHIPTDDGLGEDAPPELENGEGLDLPDVGAPPAGEPMPPAGGDVLPPPVPAPAAGGKPGLAFSHVLQRKVGSRRSFVARRADAGGLSNNQIIAEAVAGFPGFRVAKLNREEGGIAVVAMVAKH